MDQMMTHNYQTLIEYKYPNSTFSMGNPNDYSTLVWMDTEVDKPTKEFLDSKIEALNNAALQECRFLRSKEYPSIGDQLDALFKAGLFPPEMAAQIQAVKDKYPKPLTE